MLLGLNAGPNLLQLLSWQSNLSVKFDVRWFWSIYMCEPWVPAMQIVCRWCLVCPVQPVWWKHVDKTDNSDQWASKWPWGIGVWRSKTPNNHGRAECASTLLACQLELCTEGMYFTVCFNLLSNSLIWHTSSFFSPMITYWLTLQNQLQPLCCCLCYGFGTIRGDQGWYQILEMQPSCWSWPTFHNTQCLPMEISTEQLWWDACPFASQNIFLTCTAGLVVSVRAGISFTFEGGVTSTGWTPEGISWVKATTIGRVSCILYIY